MSEFLEDDEDWVWKNAVKKDDKALFYIVLSFLRSDFDKWNRYFMRLVMLRLFH